MNPTQPPYPTVVEILLVEDNPLDADLTLRALKRYRLANHVVWVKNGLEALDLIFGLTAVSTDPIHHAPKLVLLDLKLPKIDGHEVLRRLKSDPRTKTIPVVVMTSSHEEADLLRACQSGSNSYIVKPVDFDNFMEAVRQLGLYWLLLNKSPTLPQQSPNHD
ncbi:MAG TPA: response regulator [Candidatus Paceibacterota bacterium]|nr:response regulator [Verrucomicrobiota bacterium]HRY48743.1 response regulator [Candidatus Paceibacterota bacterium]HSA02828.1 response regulator [Candidatus Paceibacterota bacterium]